MTRAHKLIIGLTGPMVAGKGAVADYLANNYGASVYGFSTPLRDVLKRLHLPIVRNNLAQLSQCLRQQFGENLISQTVIADIAADPSPIVVLDGIRRLADTAEASRLPGFVLIKVEAPQALRYQRLLKRSQNADDQVKTFEEFQRDELAEADKDIPSVMAQAQHSIDNSGNLEELYAQVDSLLAKL